MNVNTLIDQIDLVEYAEKFTTLTESGNTYRGVCPICNHGNPSEFCVYDHRTFHCWVCGKAGISFKSLLRNINAPIDYYEKLNVDFKSKYKKKTLDKLFLTLPKEFKSLYINVV